MQVISESINDKPHIDTLEQKLANFDVTDQTEDENFDDHNHSQKYESQELDMTSSNPVAEVTKQIETIPENVTAQPIPQQTMPQMPPMYPMMLPGQPMAGGMGMDGQQMPMMYPMMGQNMQMPVSQDGSQQFPMYSYMMPIGYNRIVQPGGIGEDGKEKPQIIYMQPVYMYPPGGYPGMQGDNTQMPMYMMPQMMAHAPQTPQTETPKDKQ